MPLLSTAHDHVELASAKGIKKLNNLTIEANLESLHPHDRTHYTGVANAMYPVHTSKTRC
jgi:hypothetical protein